MNALKVTLKSVYGKEYIYPACETSKLLTELTGKRTLSLQAIETIKKLGYTVEVVAPPRQL